MNSILCVLLVYNDNGSVKILCIGLIFWGGGLTSLSAFLMKSSSVAEYEHLRAPAGFVLKVSHLGRWTCRCVEAYTAASIPAWPSNTA